MTQRYEFNLLKDLSLWSKSEKDAFVDMIDFNRDYGHEISEQEVKVFNDIIHQNT